MDQEKLRELRDYYDTTDTSPEMSDAVLDVEVDHAPMLGITVRLPSQVLQRVRDLASVENVKTTALIRRWIEENVRAADATRASVSPNAPRPGTYIVGCAATNIELTGFPADPRIQHTLFADLHLRHLVGR